MNTQITLFSRLAGYTVNKALSPKNREYNHDRAQMLINNAQLINDSLVRLAVKVIRKAANREDINKEELLENLNNIIHLSVVSYTKRAH